MYFCANLFIMCKYSLCGMTADNIYQLIKQVNFGQREAVKVATWLYRRKIKEIPEITDIPKALKEFLTANFTSGIFYPVAMEYSVDGCVKYLFSNDNGRKFETVYLPDKKRKTVCVSTQSGCRMGCPMCLSGSYGFHGNLTAGEILSQILSLPEASGITHVVFMGMGEPLDNLEEVKKACGIIGAEWGLAISPRNVTVSTVGIMPAVKEFLEKSECNLTVSLHSPFPAERKKLAPVEKKYPVLEIIDMMKSFPLNKKRRLSLSYIMINELNDTDNHLNAIKELLRGTSIRINLLPYHKSNSEVFSPSPEERMLYFKQNLVACGISASIRRSRGEDISAACGQLAAGLKQQTINQTC